ncbi:PfkB family carbohydrate kinase [Mycolicibacterium sp. P1-5]|uniref:PfkB family carbohydrate kinase n=1 Tax=Mycolicibacterium sp. P1-5 TaxID=2024617 RepID=UPI0011EDBD78|nr:PfkB family carbohydrate kinase [Mycolicibacterium sp. P1-5]KAA0104634.1 bifunctional heptose 7-phosphate kinase/heptose 1-phosphate adenyltransferase [Mycolicibacterium sp. P1-5]
MTGALVIVGDSMLDVDIEGSANRLSPEAPVPVVDAERMWERPGGAGLAAMLAARSEPDVVLITAIAGDAHGRSLVELLTASGARVIALPLAGTTVCKTRIRAGGQSMLRLDRGDGTAAHRELPAEVANALADARAVCVADYGNGITAHPKIRELLAQSKTRVPIVWDPHPRGTEPVADLALITPNESEAAGQSAESLRERWNAKAVCVTLGARGALLATRDGAPQHVPMPPGVSPGGPGDTCGAGDRFAVAAAAALGRGADALSATAEAVAAASRFVAAGGAVGVSTAAAVSGVATTADDTVIGGDIDAIRDRLRHRGGTLVATGGCFDLLHTGHVRLLHQARQLGSALVVLLNSDDSVRALKGPSRPVMAADDRARVLAALACVDAVCIFDEPSPEAVLELLRPDIWVKGGDYRAEDLPEAQVVTRHGGEVVILPTVAGYSSSKLIASARS